MSIKYVIKGNSIASASSTFSSVKRSFSLVIGLLHSSVLIDKDAQISLKQRLHGIFYPFHQNNWKERLQLQQHRVEGPKHRMIQDKILKLTEILRSLIAIYSKFIEVLKLVRWGRDLYSRLQKKKKKKCQSEKWQQYLVLYGVEKITKPLSK